VNCATRFTDFVELFTEDGEAAPSAGAGVRGSVGKIAHGDYFMTTILTFNVSRHNISGLQNAFSAVRFEFRKFARTRFYALTHLRQPA
jgi:hypothetical protein